jgi:gamma-glutamylcyclotransferase (GGCT)/AIG2-like uncharacterized protein YtfP
MTNRLFVYGTLAPGESNEYILADIIGTWQPAIVRGTFWQEGGADIGCPGMIPSAFYDGHGNLLSNEIGYEIKGLIFTSEHLPDHWQRLDDFEGEGYVRQLIEAKLIDDSNVKAYIYALVNAPSAD